MDHFRTNKVRKSKVRKGEMLRKKEKSSRREAIKDKRIYIKRSDLNKKITVIFIAFIHCLKCKISKLSWAKCYAKWLQLIIHSVCVRGYFYNIFFCSDLICFVWFAFSFQCFAFDWFSCHFYSFTRAQFLNLATAYSLPFCIRYAIGIVWCQYSRKLNGTLHIKISK